MRACRRIGATASARLGLARRIRSARLGTDGGAPVTMALLLLVATAYPVRAGAEAEHIRVQYAAPKKCPDGAAFIRALRQRTDRFQLASGAEQARVFVVSITAAESLVLGRLEIQGPGAEVSLRDVSGKTCDEVMAALALMTALAIDPSALAAAAPATRAPSPAASADSGDLARSRPDRPSSEAVPVAAVPAAPSAAASPGWQWSVGAQGGASLRLSPTAGLGALLFVEAAAPGASALGPVLRAGLFVNQSEVTVASGAGAKFQWAAALLEGCPLRLGTTHGRLALHACLACHVGVLRGQGRDLDRPEASTNLWTDLGPVARLRATISPRFFLEAQGMLAFPLRRVTYEMHDGGPSAPPTRVFAVPLYGALIGIGVGYGFE
jgi:hypothetical protein